MKNNRFEAKNFIFNYSILVLLYFIGRIINNNVVYLIVCALATLLIINSMCYLNTNLKTKGCSKGIRVVLSILVPSLIILFFYMIF
ncbi:hypothetical protein SAMN04487886_11843 [Clostridium sp. DSM 8431]|uniref:hypothetical protein n=1 Tax=Clostridium sp. DSM 8431 TaxID=1761781 RepID=UPI0008E5CD04|nr:hypothetical protein [Clostridium sp. DSM 8431]SFU81549.1 hypothetical protein SAMN04487886_11843 [Clostridium sp. DSM 8431]